MKNKSGGCTLCPRKCRADRISGETGFCGCGASVRVARAALHFWEEPPISGTRGSGTVFFSGCQLKCCFCQNYMISHEHYGADIPEEKLEQIFLALQEKGAHNINLVSATPYTEAVIRILTRIRGKSLNIPVVWNSGGYETTETLKRLDGLIDIYLPDIKYKDPVISEKYSKARDYFETAIEAVSEMVRQTGPYRFDETGMLISGTVIRHLVLPGQRHDSLAVIAEIGKRFSSDTVLLSLMSQYTPFYKSREYPEINRRITTFEYESVCRAVTELGYRGYFQEKSSAKEEYTPPFDLEGVL